MIQSRRTAGAGAAPGARRAVVASPAMRRSRRLALALSVCALGAPALAHAAQAGATTPGATTPTAAVKSPFAADRASSKPSGLAPDNATTPVRYPEQSVILTWGDVPDAAGYSVEIADNPGFSSVLWKASTTQSIAVPEILLPDGAYWWRVRAVDAAGTLGLWSDVGRVAKTWPSQIGGTRVAATPTGGGASFTALNPYFSWSPVPGAKSYDVEVSPGDQFNDVVFRGESLSQSFATPAAAGALPDDTYSWRVRARDPKDNPGPWTVATTFTKSLDAPQPISPADDAATHDLRFTWEPIEGVQKYEVQITDREFNWNGNHIKVSASTSSSAFVPTVGEQTAQSMVYGDLWWRVRPVINDVTGAWSTERKVTWQAPASGGPAAVLGSTGDSDTGLSPQLSWTPVTGMRVYQVEIAADPLFSNIRERVMTSSTSWVPRTPLRDNQIGAGYYWRVIWGDGVTEDDPEWKVSPGSVATATFRKQTRVTLGLPANGGVVQEPPLLTWAAVPGIGKYDVELSQDGQFAAVSTRRAGIFGLGAVPGVMADGEKRLPEGTWSWRVRAVDGSGVGQSWSPIGSFTLSSQRPVQKLPADGASVVFSPLVTWSPVSGACGYDVQVSRDPSFGSADTQDLLSTAQTAIVPPKVRVTTPGLHHWRVRADYCSGIGGQWSPSRSFRSVFPPSFNLNSIPKRVEYRKQVVIGGQLKNNGASVKKARLYLERRIFPKDTYRPAGMVRTDNRGRFRFGLRMNRSADYRLVWRESASNPQGVAAFGIDVAPRVTFRLASSRVTRKKGLLVKGSIYPRRPAVVQVRTSDGWQTVRRLNPTRRRFLVVVPTGRIEPGTHRLRLYVPRDTQRRFATVSSRQRGVLVYDRFVVR